MGQKLCAFLAHGPMALHLVCVLTPLQARSRAKW